MYKLTSPISNCIAIFGLSYEERFIFGLTRTILSFYPTNIILVSDSHVDTRLIAKNLNFVIKTAKSYKIRLEHVTLKEQRLEKLLDQYSQQQINNSYILNLSTLNRKSIFPLINIL